VDFDIIDELLTRYSEFVRYRGKWEYNGTVHQLFIDFKKVYYSVRREKLYNFLIEFGRRMKLVRLIKICLNETYVKLCICKHLSDAFSIQNFIKQGDALSPLLLNFPLEYAIMVVQEKMRAWN
jgi:hypothetical protein